MAPATGYEEFTAPFDVTKIMKLLPHRYPFLMVDKVLELEPGKRIKAIRAVTHSEPWVPGHFPGRPIMPGVLLIETLAQAAGMIAIALPEHFGKLAVLGGAESVRVRRMVTPGDVLTIEAEMLYMKMGASRIKGSISVGDELALTGEILFMTIDP